jgi:hypothetical protein
VLWLVSSTIHSSSTPLVSTIVGMSTEAIISPSQGPRWRRVVRVCLIGITWLIAGIAALLAALLGASLLLMWSCEPPSLNRLARRFPQQRRDLETIVSMSDHDVQLTRIDPTWLNTRDHQYLAYSPETGITQERWDEYRRLFARNDITQGIQRDPETTDAFIIVGSFGLLNRGHSNGYLYCGPGPSHRYPPCSSSQAFGEHPYSPGDGAYSFRKLADRWYAYSEGPS